MLNRLIPAIVCFMMVGINVPFIVADPTGNVMNWVSGVGCFLMGLACIYFATK